ncbi:transposase [Aeromonas allosaccharophila]
MGSIRWRARCAKWSRVSSYDPEFHYSGADASRTNRCSADAHIGAVAFIHLFGSSLNEHVHFQCCVFDGVLGPAAFADAQACVRPRTLVDFVRRGLIDKDDATVMRAWANDGHFHLPRPPGWGRCYAFVGCRSSCSRPPER